MRYFKYKNPKKTVQNALRAQYAELTRDEKRLVCKARALNAVGTILCFAVGIACFIGCFALIDRIPVSDSIWSKILKAVCMVVLWIPSIVLSALIGGLVGMPFWSRANVRRRGSKRAVLSEATMHLREYYGLGEAYLITKCYDSSDKRFTNHDVCIFASGDELRITVNLVHGFFHGENDLGCYAFRAEEIVLSKQQDEKFLIADLRAGEAYFLLGYRAKGFIEKHFLLSDLPT